MSVNKHFVNMSISLSNLWLILRNNHTTHNILVTKICWVQVDINLYIGRKFYSSAYMPSYWTSTCDSFVESTKLHWWGNECDKSVLWSLMVSQGHLESWFGQHNGYDHSQAATSELNAILVSKTGWSGFSFKVQQMVRHKNLAHPSQGKEYEQMLERFSGTLMKT